MVVARRLACSMIAVGLWYWGVAHWPRPPTPYGVGFWAWISALVLLLVAWIPFARPRLPRLDATWWLAVFIVAVAAMLRFYRVDLLPFAAHFDESTGFFALETMRAGTAENIFSRVDFSTGNPGLVLGLEYLLGFVTPNRFVANRYASAIWGTLSIVATYGLARRLHSPSVALVASTLLTLSSWHLLQSRFQSFFLTAPCAAAVGWWAVVRACEARRVVDAVVAGIVLGFGLQLYHPVKVLLVAIPVWWTFHAVVSRGFLRRTWAPMGVTLAVAGMSLAPWVTNVGWGTLWLRVVEVSPVGAEFGGGRLESPGSTWSLLQEQMERQARLFTGGAHLAANHPAEEPLLNWAELGGAVLGAVVAVRAITDWRATIAPIWLLTTAVAVLLSSVPEALYRLAVALPALAVLAAVGWVAIGRWLRSLLPRRVAVAAVVAAGLVVIGYDVSVNSARALRYLDQMNRADEFTTLGREIASGSPDAVYYVVGTRGQREHRVLRSLIHQRTVVDVPNLTDQVPRDVDPRRPAVFVLPFWASAHGVAYVRSLYRDVEVREIRDPSGVVAGHIVSVDPEVLRAAEFPADSLSCGLRRVRCERGETGIDPYIAFLDLAELCGASAGTEAEWRGMLIIGDPPPIELGFAREGVSTTLTVDRGAVDLGEAVYAPIPLCLAPGPHEVSITAETTSDRASVAQLSLWWRLPGRDVEVVPCAAFSPATDVGQGPG